MDALLAIAQKLTRIERRLAALETREYTQAVEGSWTPTDASGASLSLTVGAATYVKIGRLVVAMFSITYPSTASAAQMKIGGLPYTSENSGTNSWPVALSLHQFAAVLTGLVDNNSTNMRFADGTGVVITNAAYSGKQIRGAAIYRVA